MLNDRQTHDLKSQGFCVIPEVIGPAQLESIRDAFDHAVVALRESGYSTHDARLDPNAANIRLYDLPEKDASFIDLLLNSEALECVEAVLGKYFLISNFTANNALPGSAPMRIHSDQALALPPPWVEPWTINVIWCLDDVDEENGATRYLPDSHRIRTFDDAPADMAAKMRPFEAPAGSIIAMDGRLWHSSGSNTSTDRQRRLCFAYYCMDFVRPQANWEAILSPKTKESLNEQSRRLFALGRLGNSRLGGMYSRQDLT